MFTLSCSTRATSYNIRKGRFINSSRGDASNRYKWILPGLVPIRGQRMKRDPDQEGAPPPLKSRKVVTLSLGGHSAVIPSSLSPLLWGAPSLLQAPSLDPGSNLITYTSECYHTLPATPGLLQVERRFFLREKSLKFRGKVLRHRGSQPWHP